MSQLLLRNARVVLENTIEIGGVLARDGRIAQVFIGDEAPVGVAAGESVDLGAAYVAPGFIDIHIHGSAGVDVLETDQSGLTKLSEFLLAQGVSGYFATLVPANERDYRSATSTLNSYIEQQGERSRGGNRSSCAQVLGIHFEGPFVNENRCGALRREHFRNYDGDPRSLEMFIGSDRRETSEQQASAFGGARLITIAPEIEGGLDLARELVSRGLRVFIGHSQADPDTLDSAAEAGARHITHFPNALDPLHHRKPGAVAWGLVRGDVTLDCIADLHHVHPLTLRLMYKSKGADRMALIRDAILATGLGDGEFSVWGEKISVRNGRTALVRGPSEGRIAGSVITLRQAVKNMVGLGVPIYEAIHMASLVPARVAGIERDYGSIEKGKRADLVAFDEELDLRVAVVGGALALDLG